MKLKQNLYRQLITIVLIMFGIIYVSISIVLPKILSPIYEKNIYLNLQAPLDVVQSNIGNQPLNENIAYIFRQNGYITTSNNLSNIINLPVQDILKNIKKNYGKFSYKGITYYYNTKNNNSGYYIVALSNDDYMSKLRVDVLKSLIPVLVITLLIILIIVAVWSQFLVDRIKGLKNKVDNLDNDEYVSKNILKMDDEIEDLSHAIDQMKETLKMQDEYKNQMYQNVSHDFKTPITVIKSYIEAIEDGIEDEKTGLAIIKQELKKLEIKVHSLLYLNKLTYMKNTDNYKKETINIVDILTESTEKFKLTRSDVKWQLNITDKKTIFNGTYDMWEAIIDNIYSNFVRYAKKEITVTVKNHQIIFHNDGPNIDESILNNIFTPYTKGIKGQFGLGLSIVKNTVSLLGYNITVHNDKKGVSFVIK